MIEFIGFYFFSLAVISLAFYSSHSSIISLATSTLPFLIFFGLLSPFFAFIFPFFNFSISVGDIYFIINSWYFNISYSLIWLMLFIFYLCIYSIYSYFNAWPNNLSTNLLPPVSFCNYSSALSIWGYTLIFTAFGKEFSMGFWNSLAYLILWLNRDFFLVDYFSIITWIFIISLV